jgi:glycosyltransferase involved in cell wall biosynthesis
VAVVAQVMFRLAKALLGRQGRALKHYAINRRFIAAALELQPDVVHCHDLNTLWAGTQVKRRTGCRLVYDSHELATARNRMGTGWRLWCEFWEKRGIPHADAVIMASPGYADAARERYGIESTVIVNVPEPQTPTGTRDLRAATGLPTDRTLLIYQGSIQENRGIEQVIDAVELLTDVCLVIVGYGYHRPALERLVRERGLDDRIRFFGPVPNSELVDWSSSADIGMCNIVGTSRSYRESLPNKLFEYVMAGIPVVASNFGSMGRIVEEEEVGETCDPTDPAALAAAVKRIADDPERAGRYRANAAVMAARYNWEVEQASLRALYVSFGPIRAGRTAVDAGPEQSSAPEQGTMKSERLGE